MDRPRQIIHAIRTCPEASLTDNLERASGTYRGLGGSLLVVLTSASHPGSKLARLRLWGRGLPLHDAWARLLAAGFWMTGLLARLGCVEPTLHLALADFELLLMLWPRLEGVEMERSRDGTVKHWVGVRFFKFWQSPAGAAVLHPEILQRLRPLWEKMAPSVAQRLSPERACGLGWSPEETVSLLEQHVDANGDSECLVRELLERSLLTPALVNAHQGLAGGLLRAAPAWLAEKMMAGEVTLVKPQATVARLAVAALAANVGSFTQQNVRHLIRFVDDSIAPLADKSNALRIAIDGLVTMIGRVPADGNAEARATLIARISAMFVDDDGHSRVAEIPHPRALAGEAMGARSMGLPTFPALLEALIPTLTLDEVTRSVRTLPASGEAALPGSLRSCFYEWARLELEKEQSSAQLLRFVQSWLTRVGSREQIFALWRKAVEAVHSWSFLLASLEAVAPAMRIGEAHEANGGAPPQMSDAVHEFITAHLSAPLQLDAHRQSALAKLCALWPRRFAAEHGVRMAIELSKPRRDSAAPVVPRRSHRLAESAKQINDSLAPLAELAKVFAAHATMERTKTKEEYALLCDWVGALPLPSGGLAASLFRDPSTAERMSALLCATWSGALRALPVPQPPSLPSRCQPPSRPQHLVRAVVAPPGACAIACACPTRAALQCVASFTGSARAARALASASIRIHPVQTRPTCCASASSMVASCSTPASTRHATSRPSCTSSENAQTWAQRRPICSSSSGG